MHNPEKDPLSSPPRISETAARTWRTHSHKHARESGQTEQQSGCLSALLPRRAPNNKKGPDWAPLCDRGSVADGSVVRSSSDTHTHTHTRTHTHKTNRALVKAA